MRRVATLPLAVVLCLAVGCTAQERQRPLGIGDVRTGADTIETVRRQLFGTWELVALESSPSPGAPRVPVKATGTLVYDEYGNLTIDARTSDPSAPAAAREVPSLSFKGRATIDPGKKELRLMQMTGNVDPNEVLSPERKRLFAIDADTLTLSSVDEKGEIAAVSTWHRRK